MDKGNKSVLDEDVNVGVKVVDGKPLDDLNKEPSNEDDEGSPENAEGKEPSQEEEQPLFIQPGTVIILEPIISAEEPPKPDIQPSLDDIAEDVVLVQPQTEEVTLVPYGLSPEDEGIQGETEMDQTQDDRFIASQPSHVPKVKDPSDINLPSDLPTHFSSLGSFCKTTFAPLSSSDKGQQSSRPSENKDDSHPSADRLEIMEKSMKRIKVYQEKQLKKMRTMENNLTMNIKILQQEQRIEA